LDVHLKTLSFQSTIPASDKHSSIISGVALAAQRQFVKSRSHTMPIPQTTAARAEEEEFL